MLQQKIFFLQIFSVLTLKKKRGRPAKKSSYQKNYESFKQSDDDNKSPKILDKDLKKRGRPKKIKIEDKIDVKQEEM